MKKGLFFVLLITILITMTGCNSSNSSFKLSIKESSWSGWSEDYVPEEIENEFNIELKKDYINSSGNFAFVVEEINNDNIVISTSTSYSENGSVLSSSGKTKFTIYLDKEKILNTLTLDSGYRYYLTLKK